MKLISKFHDYYDGVLRIFTDEEPVYIRKEVEKIVDRKNFLSHHKDEIMFLSWPEVLSDKWSSRIGVVGFCGELYPYVHAWENSWSRPRKDISPQEVFLYKAEEVFDFVVVKNKTKKDKKKSIKRKRDYILRFDLMKNDPWLKSFFLEYGVPCFNYKEQVAYGNNNLILNPVLKDLQFQKVFDPYQAVQELNMYLGSVLVSENDLPVDVTDDEILQKKKGFTHKYSFRKPPKD